MTRVPVITFIVDGTPVEVWSTGTRLKIRNVDTRMPTPTKLAVMQAIVGQEIEVGVLPATSYIQGHDPGSTSGG